jgi:hypothetical protein
VIIASATLLIPSGVLLVRDALSVVAGL